MIVIVVLKLMLMNLGQVLISDNLILIKKGLLKEAFKDTDLVTARTVIYWTLTFKGIEALNF